jgi:hypothetical protein
MEILLAILSFLVKVGVPILWELKEKSREMDEIASDSDLERKFWSSERL